MDPDIYFLIYFQHSSLVTELIPEMKVDSNQFAQFTEDKRTEMLHLESKAILFREKSV